MQNEFCPAKRLRALREPPGKKDGGSHARDNKAKCLECAEVKIAGRHDSSESTEGHGNHLRFHALLSTVRLVNSAMRIIVPTFGFSAKRSVIPTGQQFSFYT